VAMAGGLWGTRSPNTYYYLNSANGSITGDKWWWTMSPSNADSSNMHYADVFIVGGSTYPGYFAPGQVDDNSRPVRPVLSLKSCVLVSRGNGTTDSPYEVELSSACASAEN